MFVYLVFLFGFSTGKGCGRGWWEAGAPADLGFLRTLQGRVGRGPLGCVSAGDRADGQGAH